jgi:hypothetical protein
MISMKMHSGPSSVGWSLLQFCLSSQERLGAKLARSGATTKYGLS